MARKHLINITLAEGTLVPVVSGKRKTSATNLASLFRRLALGTKHGVTTVESRVSATAASGTLTLSSASGTVGGTINGVSVTVTASGGDTATATAIAAAINASGNALVQNIVTASSSGAVVTITSAVPGIIGNCITLAASGTGVSASGARLTSGAETRISYTY